jgi:hypothetical protein
LLVLAMPRLRRAEEQAAYASVSSSRSKLAINIFTIELRRLNSQTDLELPPT